MKKVILIALAAGLKAYAADTVSSRQALIMPSTFLARQYGTPLRTAQIKPFTESNLPQKALIQLWITQLRPFLTQIEPENEHSLVNKPATWVGWLIKYKTNNLP